LAGFADHFKAAGQGDCDARQQNETKIEQNKNKA
jgi:hypothetical protein